MKMGTIAATIAGSISNGGGLVVVNADGSVSVSPATGTGVLLGVLPPATANRALMQIGSGPVDGVTAGHYTGSASGGGFGANFASGYAGDGIRIQVGGANAFLVAPAGNPVLNLFGSAGVAGAWEAPTGQFNVVQNFAGSGGTVAFRLFIGQTTDNVQYQTSTSGILGGVRADGLMYATTAGLATKAKAGVPVDADWAVAPPDGTIVGDSTDLKLYIRLAGTWRAVTVA